MLLQCKYMGIAPIERSRIMADKDTLMEEFVATEAAKAEDAAEDAETAFEFEQAEIAAEQSL